MEPRALIFDFDGLIVDTEMPGYLAWQEVYASEGVHLEIADWLNAVGYVAGFDPRAHLTKLTGRMFDWPARDAAIARRARELIAAQPVLPGVTALIEQGLRLGYRLGVASNSTADWVEPGLARLGLRKYFQAVSTVEQVARPKPQPDVYLGALAGLGVATAAGSYAFEDSHPGVQAAKAAGLRVIAVPNPLTRHQDLSVADEIRESLVGFELDHWEGGGEGRDASPKRSRL